jgi:hypothetical protein
MIQSSRSMQRFFLVSAASLGLLAAAGPALALSTEEAIKTATAACLDSAGKQGWRTDLAKVISSRAIDADKVEVVFDLTKDGTNTARLTCPYSLSKGVATTFGNAGGATAGATTDTSGAATDTGAAASSTDTAAAASSADTGTAVNPGRAWWLLLPLGLGLLSWAALRGKDEGVAAYSGGNTGTTYATGTTHAGSGTAYSGTYTNTGTAVTTGTTTSRNILVEANAQDGQLEVREHADISSAVLRRLRNGENLHLTGHRRHDWLEVANGGWVRDIDVRYDRTAVRFS